jgi:DNA-binding MarR family transcriptional regulator
LGKLRSGGRKNNQAAAQDREAGIDYGPLAEWIGFNLRMAQDASFQSFSHRSKDIGVRPGRFATLTLIGRNPGITQTALSRANSRDKSTLTPLVADLVRRGLIRRTRAPDDQRTYRLSLTPAGTRLLDQLTACAREHERELDTVIGARERAQFLRTLKKLGQRMG